MWHHIWVRIDAGAVKDFQKLCLGRVVRHHSLCFVMCNACLLYHNTLLWLTELLNIQLFVGINLILSCRSMYCHLKCRMSIRQVFRINVTSSKIHILGSFLAGYVKSTHQAYSTTCRRKASLPAWSFQFTYTVTGSKQADLMLLYHGSVFSALKAKRPGSDRRGTPSTRVATLSASTAFLSLPQYPKLTGAEIQSNVLSVIV